MARRNVFLRRNVTALIPFCFLILNNVKFSEVPDLVISVTRGGAYLNYCNTVYVCGTAAWVRKDM